MTSLDGQSNIVAHTSQVVASMADAPDPRMRDVMASLIGHLHEFASDIDLTHEEWMAGIKFLTSAGEISDADRNEFILSSDVLGLSAVVDMMSTPISAGVTEASVLGPFYAADAPLLEYGGSLIGDNEGDHVVVTGVVCSTDGTPISGTVIEVWQGNGEGLYPKQDPSQHPDNLRCRMITDDKGRYCFATIRPVPYMVPADGPVGALLTSLGRHRWRAGHFHFKLTAKGHTGVTTEVFASDDPYLEKDTTYAVRPSLTARFTKIDDKVSAGTHNVSSPYFRVEFNFTLAPSSSGRDNSGDPHHDS